MTYNRLEYKNVIVGYAFVDGVHTHNYDHEKAHELLETMLMAEYGVCLGNLNYRKRDKGKPYFEESDITFNLSHCRGLVACVLGKGVEVGIDCENVRDFKYNVAKRVCSDSELEELSKSEDEKLTFFKYWTYKESIIKLTGTGIACELSKVTMDNEKYDFKQWILENNEDKYYISVAKERDVV